MAGFRLAHVMEAPDKASMHTSSWALICLWLLPWWQYV